VSRVPLMTTNVAQRGINPNTGGAAFRDIAYTTLRFRPGQTFTPVQVSEITRIPVTQIRPALNGLNSKNYPFVHRLSRGEYVFDDTRPERVWSNFIPKRKPRKSTDVRRVASVVASTPRFVETFPVFERDSRGITLAPDAFVLKDEQGNLWQATKV
jgi:hypothetical protein